MGVEIERKFLVKDDSYKAAASGCLEIRQAYLNTDPDRTVRVRVSGEHGYLTVKGRNHGAERREWEFEIPVGDAREMAGLCDNGIEKRRWLVAYGGRTWEVDEYAGRHAGLVVAEVELESTDAEVDIPPFIGKEVTGDPAYYNSTLSKA